MIGFIKKSNWDEVSKYVPPVEASAEIFGVESTEEIAELRKRFLEAEKSSYWHQFKDGMLGPIGVTILSDNISQLLDQGGMEPLSQRKDLEESWKISSTLVKFSKWPLIGRVAKDLYLEKMMRKL